MHPGGTEEGFFGCHGAHGHPVDDPCCKVSRSSRLDVKKINKKHCGSVLFFQDSVLDRYSHLSGRSCILWCFFKFIA